VLVRGDLGELDSAGTATVARGVNVERYIGWMQSRLAYRFAPLSAVAADLERWYDIELRVPDARLAEARVTVVLDGGTADEAAQLLAEVLEARYERVGRVVTLYRRGQ
jgi:ferric-dicitrate binding protein FerR (iron transport regulator)